MRSLPPSRTCEPNRWIGCNNWLQLGCIVTCDRSHVLRLPAASGAALPGHSIAALLGRPLLARVYAPDSGAPPPSHPTPHCRRGGRVQLMALPMPDSDYYNAEKGGPIL